MTRNKELTNFIKKKNFKTFWHCLDYLQMAGYSPMESFNLTMIEFGEDKIYSDVAFIRYEIPTHQYNGYEENKPKLIVGILDESNIQLTDMFKMYRKMMRENENGKGYEREMENFCEKIEIMGLTSFILDYLVSVSEKNWGFKAFYAPLINVNMFVDNLNALYEHRR